MNAVTAQEPQQMQVAPEANLLPADPMISMIERVAMDPQSDLEKLEKMLEMKERHDAAQARSAYAAAFALASSDFPNIPLNGKGHNGKPYALLKDIMSGTRPALSKQGLALTFAIDTSDKIKVTAKLMHKAGHCETTSIVLPSDSSGSKNAVQAVGEDTEDDGRGAGEAPKRPNDQWTHAIVSEMDPSATPRDKAMEICKALVAQFDRMKGEKQLMNEWDRRAHLIEGDKGFESKHPDLHMTVVDAYENRMNAIKEAME